MATTKYRTDSHPYKVYTALLTQSGTSSNSVSINVLENTLGVIPTILRSDQGNYTITATGSFVNPDKVAFIPGVCSFITGSYPTVDNFYGLLTGYVDGDDTYEIFTANIFTDTFEDGLLNKTTIEIRVYS